MAPYSSTLAWKIPWMEEPDGLQSMGSLRVRHDWVTSLSLFTFMHWRRKWQPTSVFLPGESQGWQSLVGCHVWGRQESDTTEVTQQASNVLLIISTWIAHKQHKSSMSKIEPITHSSDLFLQYLQSLSFTLLPQSETQISFLTPCSLLTSYPIIRFS